MHSHHPALLLTLAATLAAPAVAGAQVASDTARAATVVVTATRTPIGAARVPAAVSVLSGDSLRLRGIASVADALRLVPGVAVVQGGSYGAPASLFVRGGENDYTKVLVDGVPVNDPGGAIDVADLSIDDVERIEVVRGPSSVVWGSDAVTGVINIITRRNTTGLRAASAQLAARGGTYGARDLAGGAQLAGERVRATLGGGVHGSNGIYDFNSRYRTGDGQGAIAVAPWAGGAVDLTGSVSDGRAHYPTDYTGAAVDSNDYRTTRRGLWGLRLAQQLGAARLTLDGRLTTTRAENVAPANSASAFDGLSRFGARAHRRGLELRAAAPLAGLQLVVGAGEEWESQDSWTLFVPNGGTASSTGGNARRSSRALFAEAVRDIGATTATLGARLDHSGQYGDFGTYRVALSHRLPTGTRLRASLGTSFREPSFTETQPSDFATGSPDLRPERATSWEAGVSQELPGGRASLGATYFDQRFVDMIDYRPDASGFSGTYYNVARARADGVESEANVAATRALDLRASYTWLATRVLERGFSASPQATLVEGEPLLRRPKSSASAGLDWHPRFATLDAQATYVGTRDDRLFLYAAPYVRNVTLPAYTKVDVAADVPIAPRRGARVAALTLRVDDLFGASYQQVAGYASPGRVVLAGVRLAF